MHAGVSFVIDQVHSQIVYSMFPGGNNQALNYTNKQIFGNCIGNSTLKNDDKNYSCRSVKSTVRNNLIWMILKDMQMVAD